MHSTNQITIKADPATIFRLAADVQDWGRILPHYRYVRVLHETGKRKWVEMSARRDFVPVTWTAIQTVEPARDGKSGSINFRHIRGLVRGMDVEWWFVPRPDRGDVLVGITHRLDNPPFPTHLLGPRLVEAVVARGFIGNIAGKTLKRIKELAEDSDGKSSAGVLK